MTEFIVIKKTTTTRTEVFEVDAGKEGQQFPALEDQAVTATQNVSPMAVNEVRDVKFTVMYKTESKKG